MIAEQSQFACLQKYIRRDRCGSSRTKTAAFDDYVRLIRDNERYAGVPGSRTPREFALALVRGGYATDPRYADKIVSILQDRRFRAALPG